MGWLFNSYYYEPISEFTGASHINTTCGNGVSCEDVCFKEAQLELNTTRNVSPTCFSLYLGNEDTDDDNGESNEVADELFHQINNEYFLNPKFCYMRSFLPTGILLNRAL